MTVKAPMPVRILNLVAPLPHEGTAMRTTETAATAQARSGAVSPLIGASLRQGDVDSANERSTPATTPGIRTSATATRTTTTRSSRRAPAPSADSSFSFSELVQAYLDCRQHKRNTASALEFEARLESNLCALFNELASGEYRPGRSICFVITRPKPREVWAAEFRDRIVHHLVYNRIADRFIAGFVAGSSACIPGRGTLYAAKRLEAGVRSVSQNWSRPAWYLKCDLANFFVAIDKNILHEQLAAKIPEPWWLWLTAEILFHDPRENVELRGRPELLAKVPPHKSLFNAPPDTGLPIGNLSSQFFANVYLNALDQFCKHQIGARHYVRYVDDFILLHESPQWLNAVHDRIRDFLPARLGAHLNPTKTVMQPVSRGIDFVGQVVKPWYRTTRPRTLRNGIERLRYMPASDVFQAGNSYLGLVRQAGNSHREQADIARTLMRRGHVVAGDLTKIFRRAGESPALDWVIVGGESGPGARPMQLNWARSIVQQCRAAGVPVHVKQLGHHVLDDGMSSPGEHWPSGTVRRSGVLRLTYLDPGFMVDLKDRKGGDGMEWPEDLRVKEFPLPDPASRLLDGVTHDAFPEFAGG